tara:strand:+ start:186 stop:446 length:261 start_codon:yes stop_codon:yes gene_type:complete
MSKEEWIANQLEEYRIKLEKEYDRYIKRESALRIWIKENKDIEPEICEVVGILLNNMMKMNADSSQRYWATIRLFMRETDNNPHIR